MVVLVLTAVPAGLRGHVTRWLLEISPGIFVGALPRRVRDELWDRVVELCKNGRAVMVETARNEQRLSFRVHKPAWEVVDLEGLQLVRRPAAPSLAYAAPRGWSNASKWRRSKGK